jgi:hypothetical protein
MYYVFDSMPRYLLFSVEILNKSYQAGIATFITLLLTVFKNLTNQFPETSLSVVQSNSILMLASWR